MALDVGENLVLLLGNIGTVGAVGKNIVERGAVGFVAGGDVDGLLKGLAEAGSLEPSVAQLHSRRYDVQPIEPP